MQTGSIGCGFFPPPRHTHTPQLIAKNDPMTQSHISNLTRNLRSPHFCRGLWGPKASSVKHTEHMPRARGRRGKAGEDVVFAVKRSGWRRG